MKTVEEYIENVKGEYVNALIEGEEITLQDFTMERGNWERVCGVVVKDTYIYRGWFEYKGIEIKVELIERDIVKMPMMIDETLHPIDGLDTFINDVLMIDDSKVKITQQNITRGSIYDVSDVNLIEELINIVLYHANVLHNVREQTIFSTSELLTRKTYDSINSNYIDERIRKETYELYRKDDVNKLIDKFYMIYGISLIIEPEYGIDNVFYFDLMLVNKVSVYSFVVMYDVDDNMKYSLIDTIYSLTDEVIDKFSITNMMGIKPLFYYEDDLMAIFNSLMMRL